MKKPHICDQVTISPAVSYDDCLYWLVPVEFLGDIRQPSRDHAYILPDNSIWVMSYSGTEFVMIKEGGGEFYPTLITNEDGYIDVAGSGTYSVSVNLDTENVDERINEIIEPVSREVSNHVNDFQNPHSVTKEQIGLGNVNNTSDAEKPISDSVKEVLDVKADLDENGMVLISQLPSFVDDVLEFDSVGDFPMPGESGKIYVDIGTNLTYRWSGSIYTEISPSLALGETANTAARGDWGKIAYDHSQSPHARVDATKVEKSSTNGNVLINGNETNVYTHPSPVPAGNAGPTANNSLGYGAPFTVPYIVYDANGHITGTANRTITLPVEPTTVSSALKLANPRTINGVSFDGTANIIVSNGGTGISVSGTTINHANSVTAGSGGPSANASPGNGGTFVVPQVAYDAQGHISAVTNRTITMPAAQTSVTGNAGTATTLATARTINGTSFNGSGNITTANWGTARTITIGNTGKSVNGAAAVSWTLSEIGAAPTAHASSATTYGLGTTANYGHCRVINNLTTSAHTDGYALSAYQGKLMNDKLSKLAYEEGTITLSGTPTGCSATITGEYIKIGRLVVFATNITLTNTGTSSTINITIPCLPYNTSSHCAFDTSYQTSTIRANAADNYSMTKAGAYGASKSIYLVVSNGGRMWEAKQRELIDSGGSIIVSGQYISV